MTSGGLSHRHTVLEKTENSYFTMTMDFSQFTVREHLCASPSIPLRFEVPFSVFIKIVAAYISTALNW